MEHATAGIDEQRHEAARLRDHAGHGLRDAESLERLIDEARTQVRDGLGSVGSMIGRHPVSSAAVALVAAGLVARRRTRARAAWLSHANGEASLQELLREIAHVLAQRSTRASRQARETAEEMWPEVRRRTGQLAGETAGHARELLQAGGHRVQAMARRAGQDDSALRNALAAAAGAALAATLFRGR